MSGFAHRVRAILGPTNTGKTHLAIERMLAHASGIIGFPLRLLARENYDRMVTRKGAKNVALITGEEKIVPPGARWFSCTAEAMPLDHAAEFVGVDEIQLCADPDRGHVFTDRLLHARGLVETMFLGAETIRPLLQRMVPEAVAETRPRLSRLTYTGPAKLTRLPPRTAVVAFSAGEVYAIAEAIRRRRGGCAVVMGRLSPRTRNAQVALYQEKEVDFLVATDAIGMGLNMDVDHVAFASLTKFDGHRPRRLTAPEVAQIGGRAGRGMRDGTFGTTADCPPMPDDVVGAVESHSFDRLTQLCWRNSDLDFSGIDPLLDSLNAPPPVPGLVRGNDSSDAETLAALAREPEIRRLASSRSRLLLLWETCQIPDFRKLADDTHTRLCARVFGHVVQDGRLPADWLDGQIAALSRSDGDIDTLMQRLAGVRIWSYIAARTDWVGDSAHWQGRAREVEDLLSDALHERLTARFVDRRAAHLIRRLDATDGTELLSAVTRRGEVVVEGHPVGHVGGFSFFPDPRAKGDEKKLVLRAARRALGKEISRRVGVLEAASDEAFGFADETLSLTWDEVPVARLRPGADALRLRADVLHSEFLDGPQRERVRLRLQRFLDEQVGRALSPLLGAAAAGERTPALRGLMHRLKEGLGVVRGEQAVPGALRAPLKALNVRVGTEAIFIPDLLKPRALLMRARLWAVRHRLAALPSLPSGGAVSLSPPPDWPPGFAQAMGWAEAGPVLIRLDVAERIRAGLAWSTRRGPAALPPDLASRFSVRGEQLPAVLRALGFRVLPAGGLAAGEYGPALPAMLVALRRRRPAGPAPAAREERERALPAPAGAFAALAALRVRAG